MNIRTTITVIAVAAFVAGAGALYWNHRQAIYRDGWDDAVVQVEKELELQRAANEEAMRLANQRYLRTIDELMQEKDALNETVLVLSAEAAADPGADQCGIGLGSVQRLNRIQ